MYSFFFVIGTEHDVVWESMRAAVFSYQHYIVEGVPDCIEKTEIKDNKSDVDIIKRNANKIFNRIYLVERDEQPIVFSVPKGKSCTQTHINKQTIRNVEIIHYLLCLFILPQEFSNISLSPKKKQIVKGTIQGQ